MTEPMAMRRSDWWCSLRAGETFRPNGRQAYAIAGVGGGMVPVGTFGDGPHRVVRIDGEWLWAEPVEEVGA